MKSKKTGLILLVLLGGMGFLSQATASPIMSPGYTVSTYATVSDPAMMSFDPTGVLYVGNNTAASGGGKIYRIDVGGAVTDYGANIHDPDAVLFDAVGAISGTLGSVLVGGVTSPTIYQGRITKIAPGGSSTTTLFQSSTYLNPQDMAFDQTGRLLIADADPNRGNVLVSSGGAPSVLFHVSLGVRLHNIAVDSWNRIFTTAFDGKIRIHDSKGKSVNDSFATGMGYGLAFGPGGGFGTDLYATSAAGELVRLDSLGNRTVIGTGFAGTWDLAFGPDGSLYVSEMDNDRILKVEAIPEASSLALFGLGLAALLAVFQRRKREGGRTGVA